MSKLFKTIVIAIIVSITVGLLSFDVITLEEIAKYGSPILVIIYGLLEWREKREDVIQKAIMKAELLRDVAESTNDTHTKNSLMRKASTIQTTIIK